MREWTRRSLAFVGLAAMIAAALRFDPNGRGPLSYAVEFWLAEQDERASAEFERVGDTLADLSIDSRFIALPTILNASAIAPIEGAIDLDALRTALDRACRDDRASDLLYALALARHGDPPAARTRIARWLEANPPPRLETLGKVLSEH